MAKGKIDKKQFKDFLTKPVIAFDQSYTRTGVSVVDNGDVVRYGSIDFKKHKCKTKSDKRNLVRNVTKKLIEEHNPGVIIVERIRMFSQGFISKAYIASTGALIASIVDVAEGFGIPVFSVDTRNWKAKVVGTSKHRTKNKKLETIEFVKNLGYNVNNNDDVADAICIGLSAFKEGVNFTRET